MKSVIMISSGEFDVEHMRSIYADIGSSMMQSPTRLVVEGEWGWFALEVDNNIENEFSDIELEKIGELIKYPAYAQLEYSNSSAVDLAISMFPKSTGTLIDNDHGMLRSIEEVQEMILTGVEWETSSV